MRTAAIKVNAGWGDKAWALAGATGIAGLVVGWAVGGMAPSAVEQAGGAMPKPDGKADAQWVSLFTGSAERAAQHTDQPVGSTGCDRLQAGPAPLSMPTVPAPVDTDTAERNAVLNDIIGQPGAAPLSHAELQRQGPGALLAMVANTQADADVRLEAAAAMQAYFDAPLPAPVARQVLDMASTQPDPVLQQDALDLLQGRMQPELVPVVSAFLRSSNEATREMAIQRLSELPQDSQALSALAQVASQDESEVLRYLAARRRE